MTDTVRIGNDTALRQRRADRKRRLRWWRSLTAEEQWEYQKRKIAEREAAAITAAMDKAFDDTIRERS